jgi:hypothetical protein
MRFLLYTYLLLSISDFIGTAYLTKVNGFNIESNPIPAYFYDKFGLVGMGVYKLCTMGIVVGIIAILQSHDRGRKYVIPLLCLGCIALSLTVGFTLLIIGDLL